MVEKPYLVVDLPAINQKRFPVILRLLIHTLLVVASGLYLAGCMLAPHDEILYEKKGIDVSHYQGLIDWGELSTEGLEFVFIKATEGETLRDPAFLYNWKEAGETDMRRGAYHFFRPSVNAGAQAQHYINTVELKPGDFPPVLDVEEKGRLSSEQLVSAIREWAALIELRYEVKPIIYTGQNFYNRHLAGQVDDYPLWLARYDRDEPVTVCGRPYQFWQFSDEGSSPGVLGAIDRNVFTGSYVEWSELQVPSVREIQGEQPDYHDEGPISNIPLRDQRDLATFSHE